MNAKHLVAKIVSGGQTGADQGALDAALEIGIPCGGWCPKGRKSEAGPIPLRYPLLETDSNSYLHRTEKNVVDSHATLLFTFGSPKGGSKRTVEFAKKHQRPCLHVDLDNSDDAALVREIHAWLIGGGLILGSRSQVAANPILNVAGSRESKQRGIQQRVKQLLIAVFKPDHYPTGGE